MPYNKYVAGRKRIIGPKCASGKNSAQCWRCAFVLSPQAVDLPEKSACAYDGSMTRQTIYAYVSGNPLSFFDPQGLSQQDVNEMTCLARANNPGLNIPDPEFAPIPQDQQDKALGVVQAGHVDRYPWSKPVINSDLYGGKLSPAQRVDLYNTIVHESWHYDKQPFYARSWPSNEREATRVGNAAAAKAKEQIMKGSIGSCGCGK